MELSTCADVVNKHTIVSCADRIRGAIDTRRRCSTHPGRSIHLFIMQRCRQYCQGRTSMMVRGCLQPKGGLLICHNTKVLLRVALLFPTHVSPIRGSCLLGLSRKLLLDSLQRMSLRPRLEVIEQHGCYIHYERHDLFGYQLEGYTKSCMFQFCSRDVLRSLPFAI